MTTKKSTLKNHYFVCHPREAWSVAWNPFDREEPTGHDVTHPDYPQINYDYPDINYLSGALSALERNYNLSGFTFYLTKNVQVLPSYGPNVIALLVADERCRRPAYLGHIRAIFRHYGIRPKLVRGAHKRLSLSLATLYQFVRMHLYGLRGRLKGVTADLAWQLGWLSFPRYNTAQFIIPNGYYNQLPLPLKDFSRRSVDLYFSGSLGTEHWLSAKRASREKMLKYASVIQHERPDLHTIVEVFPNFIPETFNSLDEKAKAAERYSQTLMNTKVCLVPRGTMPESARFYEALRFGCIIICDPLPDHWFYQNAPVIQLESWQALPEVVKLLFKDPENMLMLHEQTLRYWETTCSELALANFMAAALGAHTNDPNSGKVEVKGE